MCEFPSDIGTKPLSGEVELSKISGTHTVDGPAFEAVRDEVRDTVDVFDDTIDHHPHRLAGHLVVRFPHLREDDHVEEARFVLEIQEPDSPRRRRVTMPPTRARFPWRRPPRMPTIGVQPAASRAPLASATGCVVEIPVDQRSA